MNLECPKCGEIEPENHEEILWLCDCLIDKRKINLDKALKEIERKKRETKRTN